MQQPIIDALRRGAVAEALSLARVAVAEAPHDARAHALLAHAARANGDHAAAANAINRAVLLATDNAELHFQRAGFLLDDRKLNEAQAALSRSLTLDPNQFDAYIVQAQMALGRGDLDEAERLGRTAARLAPEHPWVKTVTGMVSLRRGDGARALALLTQAASAAPDDLQVVYALGFAHLQQGQAAFAEQAFRKVMELSPRLHGLRGMLADLLLQQQRPHEAREVLQPLLDDPESATPGLKRMTAELELALGRHESATILLREALHEDPSDPRTLAVLAEVWRRSGDFADARDTLDAALERTPRHAGLWQVRLAFEPEASDGAHAVIERWLQAMPEQVDALDALMHLHEAAGRREEADALAQRIVVLEPGRSSAEMRVLDRLMRETPELAVTRVEGLIARAGGNAQTRLGLLPWLGYAQDRAGLHADAVATWSEAAAAKAATRWPLLQTGPTGGSWPTPAIAAPGTPPVAYLCGLPGSGVERVAAVIGHAGYPLRDDRFGPNPPQDPMQNPDTFAAIADGRLAPERVLAEWRAALPARGVHDGVVIDWLPFWDNALLKMLRPLQPEAIVLFAVRDPRDMLLEWLAFDSVVPYGMASPLEAARWLATHLAHVVEFVRERPQPHHLVRTDRATEDIEAFAADVGGGLGLEEIRVPPPALLGPKRFPFGHWRQYAKALAEPFAQLSAVAQALGYPER
ncbi:MAG: tetratricopeptide repeat protein [Lysobacteraceae bacterium]|nr:MAG: tetratricopeptide repeat protein [Xanthomonadaceae bacterium]